MGSLLFISEANLLQQLFAGLFCLFVHRTSHGKYWLQFQIS